MQTILESFNNRELATFIWILFFVFGMGTRKEVRQAFVAVISAFFQRAILISFGATVGYVSILVLILYEVGLWGSYLFKDTVYWFISVAFVFLLNIPRAVRTKYYFVNALLNGLQVIFLLEFIINFYTFSLLVEFFLTPALFVLVGMSVISGSKEEYAPVKSIVDMFIAVYGFFVLGRAIYLLVGDCENLMTDENLQGMILPPVLTTAFIPYFYYLTVYAAYEEIFVMLDLRLSRNKSLARYAKWRALLFCRFNLSRIRRFSDKCTRKFGTFRDRSDVSEMIDNFKKHGDCEYMSQRFKT